MHELTIFAEATAKREFAQVFNRLAVGYPVEVDAIKQQVYYDALKDLPFFAVEEGATALLKERGRKFFPSTGEWREAAERAQEERFKAAVQPARDEPWRDECSECRDTGFIYDLHCTGHGECGVRACVNAAARGRAFYPHTYATPCSCRPHNRTYQRSLRNGQIGHGGKS